MFKSTPKYLYKYNDNVWILEYDRVYILAIIYLVVKTANYIPTHKAIM